MSNDRPRPIHPGEILREDFLSEYNLTPGALAKALLIPRDRMEKIVRGQRDITADTALRLGRYFGTTAQFWVNLQSNHDLLVAESRFHDAIEKISPRNIAA
ncbi:HigA family addiction module antitoxin [Agrobacterium tumefaciens]|uniref:HigA family addiction module antitoxin n=1 Tax=Agrobacterium tumefaciens TaxID=358 RepID=UPI0021D1C1A6|nr:HigA family addiction module antitoxin [Agrobacterium tumefaciens]UXS05567.1 HigA family addiction module antidote protein [Agrobacterium tumefaciens]